MLRSPLVTLALAALLALGATAQHSITTTFASNNNQAGNMFDVVGIDGLRIVDLDVNLFAGTWNVRVYTVTDGGSHIGVESNPSAWTLVASIPGVVSAGPDLPTPLMADLGIEIPAGGQRGIYVTCANGIGIRYTSGGTLSGVLADDGSARILNGRGVAYPFAGLFTPRQWNGTIRYNRTLDVPGDVATIQAAIGAALPGDTVLAAPGTYLEHDLDFGGKAITVRGPGATVNAQMLGRGFVFQSGEGADSILEDIGIINGRAPLVAGAAGSGGGILVDSSSPTIRGCSISACVARTGTAGPPGAAPAGGGPGGSGGSGGGIAIVNGSPLITDCVIANNDAGGGGQGGAGIFGAMSGSGGAGGGGGGVSVSGGFPAIIGCRLTGNRAGNGGLGSSGGPGGPGGGIHVAAGAPLLLSNYIGGNQAGNGLSIASTSAPGGPGGGLAIGGGSPIVEANVIVENTAGALANAGGLWVSGALTLTISGCTIADNAAGGQDPFFLFPAGTGGGLSAGVGATLVNSIVWNNTPNQVTGSPTIQFSDVQGGFPGTGNIDANPGFVNATGDNYHLSSGSPCASAGNRSLSVFSRDLDGEPRRMGFGLEMGADEIARLGTQGSGEDFLLETIVDGASPGADAKFARSGEPLHVRMSSPLGDFQLRPPFLMGQVFATNGPNVGTFGGFPGIHIPNGFVLFNGLAPTPFGELVLPPGGLTLAFVLPPSFAGFTARLQALVFAGFANNGIFAISRAHEVVVE